MRVEGKRFRLTSCRREIVFAEHALSPILNHESRETYLAARPSAEARFTTVQPSSKEGSESGSRLFLDEGRRPAAGQGSEVLAAHLGPRAGQTAGAFGGGG